jgi:hypothetical protein
MVVRLSTAMTLRVTEVRKCSSPPSHGRRRRTYVDRTTEDPTPSSATKPAASPIKQQTPTCRQGVLFLDRKIAQFVPLTTG